MTASGVSAAPNIVFVLLDDVDYQAAVTANVLPRIQQRLGAEGATFTRAYAQHGLCTPSRATILTGLYSQNTQVRRNAPPFGGFETYHARGLDKSSVNLHLQQAGYRTGLIGKFLNNYPKTAAFNYVPPGWDYWAVAPAPKPYDYRLIENGKSVVFGATPADYDTDVYGARARTFIDGAATAGKPFALYLWFPSVHSPVVPAPRHAGLFAGRLAPRVPSFAEAAIGDKPPFLRFRAVTPDHVSVIDANYRERLRALQAVDEAVEKIYQLLRTRGLLGNTYIVLSSDNGFHLGEHRLRLTKGFAYEESVRLPLMVRGPGVPAGRKIAQLVGNADFAPTFAQWAGLTTPLNFDGRSFAPLLKAAAPASVPWRKALPLSRLPEAKTPATAWPSIVNASQRTGYSCIATTGATIPDMRGVRTVRHTFTHYATGDMELYDNVADPYQLENRVCSSAATVRDALRSRTAALATCRGAACRRLEDAAVP